MIFNYIWNAVEIKPNMAHTKVLRVESTFAYFFFMIHLPPMSTHAHPMSYVSEYVKYIFSCLSRATYVHKFMLRVC